MGEAIIIPLVAILSIFVIFPAIVFHYITQWRRQKTLLPDDERMLEDLWRSAKAMERRDPDHGTAPGGRSSGRGHADPVSAPSQTRKI